MLNINISCWITSSASLIKKKPYALPFKRSHIVERELSIINQVLVLYKFCESIKQFKPWRNAHNPYSETVTLNMLLGLLWGCDVTTTQSKFSGKPPVRPWLQKHQQSWCETWWTVPGQACMSWPIRADFWGNGGIKETCIEIERSEGGWIGVLQLWTVYQINLEYP